MHRRWNYHTPTHTNAHHTHHTQPQDTDHSRLVLTEESKAYVAAGSPEAQVFNAVPAGGGISLADLKVRGSRAASAALRP